MERRLPVWREECRSFNLAVQKAFCFLSFWILSRLFPSIFLTVQTHEEEHWRNETQPETHECVGEQNLSVLPLFLTQCSLPAISRHFTQSLNTQMPIWICSIISTSVNLKCSHCSTRAYIPSQRSIFSKMWFLYLQGFQFKDVASVAAGIWKFSFLNLGPILTAQLINCN